jgi:hypothetical protein
MLMAAAEKGGAIQEHSRFRDWPLKLPNGFDYTRNEEVKFPDSEQLYPNEITDFIALLDEHTQDITEDERKEIEDRDLAAATKLIDITKK